MEKSEQSKQKIIRILAVSDTHDKHAGIDTDDWPQADIFIHAGDFTKYSRKKQLQRFRQFLKDLPYKHKVVIAGNHDFVLDKQSYQKGLKLRKHKHEELNSDQQIQKLKQCCTYLQHEMIQIEGVKIFGSPYSAEFCDWGFMYTQEQAEQLWSVIPKDTDVLVTHGPAHGILDYTLNKVNAGCKTLLKYIQEIKPKVHIFGHIHEAFGDKKIGQTHFYNACYVNLNYVPANQPYLIEIKVPIQQKQ